MSCSIHDSIIVTKEKMAAQCTCMTPVSVCSMLATVVTCAPTNSQRTLHCPSARSRSLTLKVHADSELSVRRCAPLGHDLLAFDAYPLEHKRAAEGSRRLPALCRHRPRTSWGQRRRTGRHAASPTDARLRDQHINLQAAKRASMCTGPWLTAGRLGLRAECGRVAAGSAAMQGCSNKGKLYASANSHIGSPFFYLLLPQ